MKRWLIIGLVLVIVLIVVLVIVLGGGSSDEDSGGTVGEVSVPVNLQGASNVGSISIELTYDSTVLEATEVKAGELTKSAMLEYNINNPGKIIIGIIDSSGINGDGTVAEIRFNTVDSGGASPLTLNTVETHDATSLIDIINETSDGSFTAEGNAVTAPLVAFAD